MSYYIKIKILTINDIINKITTFLWIFYACTIFQRISSNSEQKIVISEKVYNGNSTF